MKEPFLRFLGKLLAFVKSLNFLAIPLFVLVGIAALGNLGVLSLGSISLRQSRYITVTGSAKETLTNQVAQFNVSVNARNADKNKAVEEVNQNADTLVSKIKGFGIDEIDIETTSVNVFQLEEPIIEDGYQVYRPTDWKATIDIQVKLREVEKVSEFSSLLSLQAISNLYGPSFSIDSESVDEGSLLAEALKDAQEKAKVVALSTGRRLGSIVNITEGSAAEIPGYKYYSGYGGGGGEEAYQPGSTEVSKTVTVTFNLK